MSLSDLRRQVESLKRKLPVHYKVAMLRPHAEQFCDDWQYAVGLGYQPPPFFAHRSVPEYPPRRQALQPFMDRIRDAGIQSSAWSDVAKFLAKCREEEIYPHPNDILRIALPRAAGQFLIPPSPNPISYAHFKVKLEVRQPHKEIDG